MTELDEIRELLSDMGKYCDVIENHETSYKSKVMFTKLLIQDSVLLQKKIRLIEDKILVWKIIGGLINEQPKQNDNQM